MSFLLDALNKQKQTENTQSAYSQFAQDTAQERLYTRLKLGLLAVIVLITTFIAGFYLASYLSASTAQDSKALHNPPLPDSNDLKLEQSKSADNAADANKPAKAGQAQTKQSAQAVEPSQPLITLSELAMPVAKKTPSEAANQVTVEATKADTNIAQTAQQPQSKHANSINTLANNETAQQSKPEQAQPASGSSDFTQLNSIDDENAISAELLAKFNAAVAQTMELSDSEISAQSQSQVVKLTELDEAFQSQIPQLNFQTHIFSSEANKAWVKVNGQIVKEGQMIANGLLLKQITPQDVILEYQQQTFSLPALSSW